MSEFEDDPPPPPGFSYLDVGIKMIMSPHKAKSAPYNTDN